MKFEAHLGQRQELRQEQRITQQMIQNMELLQVPLMELSQLVMQELEQNPTLEMKEEAEEPEETPEAAETEKSAEEDRLDLLDQIDSDREFNKSVSRTASTGESVDDPEREEYIMNLAPESVSLVQHLAGQLRNAEIPDDLRQVAEHVINMVDEQGYLRMRPEDVAHLLAPVYHVEYDSLQALVKENLAKYTPDALARVLAKLRPEEPPEALAERVRRDLRGATIEAFAVQLAPLLPGRSVEEIVRLVQEAVALIQSFEPRGVGAFDTAECFLLQMDPKDPDHAKKKHLIERHLDDILYNRRPKIAEALKTGEAARPLFGFDPETPTDRVMEEVNRLVEGLTKLRPSPGATFSAEPNPAVVPDITVREVDGNYEVLLEESFLPAVGINAAYVEMLKNRKVGKEERQYIRGKLEAGRRILSAIEHRRYTLHRIAQRVIDHQKDFFEKGPEGLKPMTMTQLADEVGVHVSTVARAVKDKYLQTPRGVFSLRSFFPQAAPGKDGASAWTAMPAGATPADPNGDRTRDQVIDRIRQIVGGEDPRNPLSDKDISDKLEKDLQIQLKRRTVAKYREEAGILSSRLRRKY